MYILLFAIVGFWIYSVYSFAKWRFHFCVNKGILHETVLHDRLTTLYLRVTGVITLGLIFYII